MTWFIGLLRYSLLVMTAEPGGDPSVEAVVRRKRDDGREELFAGDGDGPVHALDCALRKALREEYPQVERLLLQDFACELVEGEEIGSAALAKVKITFSMDEVLFTLDATSTNIIHAFWLVLVAAYGRICQTAQP